MRYYIALKDFEFSGITMERGTSIIIRKSTEEDMFLFNRYHEFILFEKLELAYPFHVSKDALQQYIDDGNILLYKEDDK